MSSNFFSNRDDYSYDYEDEPDDDLDYEYDWSHREESTSTTEKVIIENNLENKGVEIRVGAHIDANNETNVANENLMTNFTSDVVAHDENSSFVINQTKTTSEIPYNSQVIDEVFEFEDLPIPAPLHQTTATLDTFNLGDTYSNIENKRMAQLHNDNDETMMMEGNYSLIKVPMTKNNKSIQNQTDMAYLSERNEQITAENIMPIVNSSNSNVSNKANDNTHHENGIVMATEKISASAHDLTSEIDSDFGGNDHNDNEYSAMYIDSDEINGITSDPHPRMLTEDLTDLVATINDSITEFLANETQPFEKTNKNDAQKSEFPSANTLRTMTNASKEATLNNSTFVLYNETNVELLPDEKPYIIDPDNYISTTTEMSSYQRLSDEYKSYSDQNISMSMETYSERIEVNKASVPSHITGAFKADLYDDISLGDRSKGIEGDIEETTLDVESYESTTQLSEINLTEVGFSDINSYGTENFTYESTVASDQKHSLNGPESYYLSENYSSQNQFSMEQKIEKGTSLISQLYDLAKEIMTSQYKGKTTEMQSDDDSQDDPVSFYLNDSPTTRNSSSDTYVTEVEDEISTSSYRVGFETTTMQNEDYSNGLSSSLIVTEEYEIGTELNSQNIFSLQSDQHDNFPTPKEKRNNTNLFVREQPNFDIAKSILLSKLFESSSGSENEEIDYITTPYVSFDYYFQQDEVDSMASTEGSLLFSDSQEEFYVTTDREQDTTTHSNALYNSSTDQSITTDNTIFDVNNFFNQSSSKIYNNTMFSMNSSSSLTNTSKRYITGNTIMGVDPIMNENSSMSKNLSETYLEDVEVINITTDVYIKSNYSYPNVEDQNYNFQSVSIEKLASNFNDDTTDYDDQNFIFDENNISLKKKLNKDESQDLLESEKDVNMRDRHQPGIKPPK